MNHLTGVLLLIHVVVGENWVEFGTDSRERDVLPTRRIFELKYLDNPHDEQPTKESKLLDKFMDERFVINVSFSICLLGDSVFWRVFCVRCLSWKFYISSVCRKLPKLDSSWISHSPCRLVHLQSHLMFLCRRMAHLKPHRPQLRR